MQGRAYLILFFVWDSHNFATEKKLQQFTKTRMKTVSSKSIYDASVLQRNLR